MVTLRLVSLALRIFPGVTFPKRSRRNTLQVLSNQKGFSLVEIILVVMVAGMIVSVVINLPNSIKLIGVSSRVSKAREIASKQIENLRLNGYSNLPSDGTYSFSDARGFGLSSFQAQYLIETCPINICVNGESTKQITVKLNWQEEAKPKQVMLTTLISEGGLK